MMLVVKEKICKSILSKSGITDYSLNCYTGCEHGCLYCYARFMRKYTGHKEPWRKFVDIKINAPLVLEKEIKRKPKGEVFISSVCNPYQPLEKKYQLTRKCLKILVENGFPITILTKSSLVKRDFDILKNYLQIDLGLTITTMDENLKREN